MFPQSIMPIFGEEHYVLESEEVLFFPEGLCRIVDKDLELVEDDSQLFDEDCEKKMIFSF